MSASQLIYFGEISDVLRNVVRLSSEYSPAHCSKNYATQIAKLHYSIFGAGGTYSYEKSEDYTYEMSLEETQEGFDGVYGKFWYEASPVLFHKNKLVAAINTVYEAPWADMPACPFIIDLMIDQSHRGMKLATWLMQETARTTSRDGASYLAFRVMSDNTPALSLYDKLGFNNWDGKLCLKDLS